VKYFFIIKELPLELIFYSFMVLKFFFLKSVFILFFIVLNINCRGYPLRRRVLIKDSMLVWWNLGWDRNIILLNNPITTPFLCMVGWFEKKFRYLPELVGFVYKSKIILPLSYKSFIQKINSKFIAIIYRKFYAFVVSIEGIQDVSDLIRRRC